MRSRHGRNGSGHEGGFGSFLRSLLAGVPWSEHAEREDLLRLPRPATIMQSARATSR